MTELSAFGDGYGLNISKTEPTLCAMRAMSALDLVRWAIDRRPDQLGELVPWARQELARVRAVAS